MLRLTSAAVAVALLGSGAAADEDKAKPLWEVGVAGGGGFVPDYPAAAQNHLDGLALPYLVYRGDFLRAGDRGIVRGRILRTKSVEFDISLDGSFATDSDDNDARRDMPDLDYLVEVGPRLQVTLARAARWAKLDFELPVRVVFSTDLSDLDYRGIVVHPELAYQHDNFLATGTELKLGIGPVFATERLHDYFYQVDNRFATPSRPAFDADAGYLGSELQLAALVPLTDRIRLFGVLQLGYYQGAANDNSPLFRDDFTIGIGVGLIWSFFQSSRQARD